ncbi:MAG: helix-turn-helix transcriptional regulator [Chloroflexota bacterium]
MIEDQGLVSFGQRLRQLRQLKGLTQVSLANELSKVHAKRTLEIDLGIDGNLISKWERAFQDKKQRTWRPTRQHVVYLIEVFAQQLTKSGAKMWAEQAGYKLGEAILIPIFSPPCNAQSEGGQIAQAKKNKEAQLTQYPEQSLFGVHTVQQRLQQAIEKQSVPWIISIDGIGGIGKSALAQALVRQSILKDRFHDVIWISAKQEEFSPSIGTKAIEQPALDGATLIHQLLEQFGAEEISPHTPKERQIALTKLMKQMPYLVIIDNLETMTDYQALIPTLRQLVKPSKFLMTTRSSLYAYSDVYSASLSELNQVDALDLLKHESRLRGLEKLTQTSQPKLAEIYNVVGGNPLALKLIVGQTCVLPLDEVLESLREAEGKKVEDLFTYIYWQSWHSLSQASRQILLSMPMISAQGGTFEQLGRVSRLDVPQLREGLERLAALSLVQVGGDLVERRYKIHRLTETFLLKEVIKWSPSH